MFKAIRQWWNGERARKLAGLFAFEFIVVMSGVLAAQWVADWSEERRAVADMEEDRTAVLKNVEEAVAHAKGWQTVIPCLDRRMDEIMRVAASGQTPTSEMLKRPGIFSFSFEPLSPRSARLLEERYGAKEAYELERASQDTKRIAERGGEIIGHWQALTQIDPANGSPGPLDRHDARKAASAIKATLVGIAINADNIVDAGQLLGLKAAVSPSRAGLPLSSCQELWSVGRTHRLPDHVHPWDSPAK